MHEEIKITSHQSKFDQPMIPWKTKNANCNTMP